LALVQNYRYGSAELKTINAFLLATYLSWILLFCTYAGTLYSQLRDFTGILGLSMALNHGLARRSKPASAPSSVSSDELSGVSPKPY
jgi:hypothetical protein